MDELDDSLDTELATELEINLSSNDPSTDHRNGQAEIEFPNIAKKDTVVTLSDSDIVATNNRRSEKTVRNSGYEDGECIEQEFEDFNAVSTSQKPNECPPNSPDTGDRVEVYWPLEGQYYSGEINEVHQDGTRVVVYDGADIETLNMSEEAWRLAQNKSLHPLSGVVERTL